MTCLMALGLQAEEESAGPLSGEPGEEQTQQPIQIESLETSYDQVLGVAKAKGNVVIDHGDATVYANEAEYHQNTGDIFVRGDVAIFKSGIVYRAEEAVYNVNSGVIVSSGLKSGFGSFFFKAGEMTLPSDDVDVIRTQDAYLTSHDNEDPNYHVEASRLTIYPEDRLVLHNAVVKAHDIPVFWLPYLSQPLDEELGYYFTPGYRDTWGPYLLNQYGVLIGDHTLAQAHLDYRERRGLAGGIDLFSRRYRKYSNFGHIQFYYANDKEPDLSPSGDPPRVSPPDEDRYRLNIQHRVYLPGPEESTLYLDVDINKLSDEFFYLDFFPGEFRDDPRPDNILNLVKYDPRGTVSLLGRFDINDFFRSDTRLPELALDATRQPIFDTKFFYEGVTTIGRYEELRGDADSDLIANPLFFPESSFTRLYTFHEILYPFSPSPWPWLNIVPKAGVGYAHYWDVDSDLGAFDSEGRTLVHAGVDASFKMSKVYPDLHCERLHVDGIRHVFQPYLNYSWLHAGGLSSNFPQIDRLTPTTKLRPLDPARFTAVDDFDDWNILRLGTMNRLHTKRNGTSYPWLNWNTYLDVYLDDPEPGFDREFSNLFNEVRWRPLPWMPLAMDSQIPIGSDGFTEINTYMHFQPRRNFQFTLGYFYLDSHPLLTNSQDVRFSTYTRLTDNLGFGTVHFYDVERSNVELQQYTLHRDLTSWTAGIGAQFRDTTVKDEIGLVFVMTLKAAPRIGLPVDFFDHSGSSAGF